MDEKIIELPKALEILQQQINAVYPFNIYLDLNKKSPQNSFVMTITKKSYNKFEKQIMQEIHDYFHNDFNVKSDLILQKREKPLFGKNMKFYFQIKVY